MLRTRVVPTRGIFTQIARDTKNAQPSHDPWRPSTSSSSAWSVWVRRKKRPGTGTNTCCASPPMAAGCFQKTPTLVCFRFKPGRTKTWYVLYFPNPTTVFPYKTDTFVFLFFLSTFLFFSKVRVACRCFARRDLRKRKRRPVPLSKFNQTRCRNRGSER